MKEKLVIKIEKGIPPPERDGRNKPKPEAGDKNSSPIHTMEVGDSFAVPEEQRHDIHSRCIIIGRPFGWLFQSAKIGNGQVRFWRIR